LIDLNDYYYFVQIIEKQGITAAAESLNMPKSRLSRHLKLLEERLQLRLVQRSSRQFHVTDAGLKFYQHARSLIDEMELAEAAMSTKDNELSGRVSFSCSVGVAQYALQELLIQFLNENPKVVLSQQVTNQTVDIISEGLDLAVRGHIDPLPDSSLVQRHLATVPWHLFAGTTYLKKTGEPTSPYDLYDRETLKLGWHSTQGVWNLENDKGLKTSISHTPSLCCDDMATLKYAATQGLGIVALPAYTCREELRGGQLERVLPGWHLGIAELTLLMPSRKGVTPAVKALRDFLLATTDEYLAL